MTEKEFLSLSIIWVFDIIKDLPNKFQKFLVSFFKFCFTTFLSVSPTWIKIYLYF